MARTEAMVTAPNEAPPFLPGSTTTPHSLFPYGEQMLSFSSTSKQDALMLSCEGPLPYYCSPSASSPTPSSYLRSAGNRHQLLDLCVVEAGILAQEGAWL